MIASHVFVITGFTQDAATPTRLTDLWLSLHSRLPGASVQLRPWNCDWRAEAELIRRTSTNSPTVVLVGYSWGAGWGVTRLASQLAKRGLGVSRAFLIDPVYRHPYWLGNWRAFLPWWPIRIPANVAHVTWWRQEMDWPAGHDLRADGDATLIDREVVVEAAHVHMDDQPAIMAAIKAEVVSLLHSCEDGGDEVWRL